MRRCAPTSLVEAWANVAARPVLSLALIALWASGLITSFLAESMAVARVMHVEGELVDAGYRTLYVEPNDNIRTPLTATDCEALGRIHGVRSAIWLLPAQPGNLMAPQGPPVSVRPMGGDVVGFLASSDPHAMTDWGGAQVFIDSVSSIVEHGRSRVLRLHVGDRSQLVEAHSTVLTTLGAGMAGNIAVVTHETEDVESCALLVDDDRRQLVRDSVAAALPVGRGYVARWALPSADRFESAGTRFAERGSQWVWLAGVAAIVVTWSMNLRIRRPDHAFYAVCGMTARRLMLLMWLELALLGLLSALAATTAVAIVAARVGDDAAAGVGVSASLRCAGVAWSVAAGVAGQRALGARRALVRQLKDR
jgi:hypothetical protein